MQIKTKIRRSWIKDVECTKLKKENLGLEKLVNKRIEELELVKKDLIPAKNKKELKCSYCDLKFESNIC